MNFIEYQKLASKKFVTFSALGSIFLRPAPIEGRGVRGALHSLEKAYEIFSEQKDLYGFLMDFS